MKFFLRTRSIRIVAALAVASGTAGLASLTALSGASAQADPLSTTAEVGVGADVTQDVYEALSGAGAPNTATTTFYTPLHADGGQRQHDDPVLRRLPAGRLDPQPGLHHHQDRRPVLRPAQLHHQRHRRPQRGDQRLGLGEHLGLVHQRSGQRDRPDRLRPGRPGPEDRGHVLTFAPFARDAVAYLYFDHGDGNLNALTTAQLKSLYSGTLTTIGGDTVKPCLTITGSTPRSNLETAIGVSDATAQTTAHNAGCDQIQQNSGNAFYSFASTLGSTTDAIIPISSGDWIAQANGVAVDESATARAHGVTVGSVNDGGTNLGLPTTGTAPNLAPNTTYYQSTSYGYNLYTVLPTNVLSGFGEDATLVSLFTNTSTLPANNAADLPDGHPGHHPHLRLRQPHQR